MKYIFLSFVIILQFLTCAPLPLESDNIFPIRLSLEKLGNKEAEFSGEPILVVIETPDSNMFSALTWRTGNGTYRTADSTLIKKAKKFTATISWKKYPLYKDSVDKKYYDTIYIGIGGNLYRSNNVRVKVSNLPVAIDSCRVGTVLFKSIDSAWTFNIHDSVKNLQIRLYARDYDATIPELEIIGNNFGIERNIIQPMQLLCSIPAGPFKDTINFIVTDHARGQAMKTLYLHRTYPNKPPVVDSVLIGTQMFVNASGTIKATFPKIDTLRFKVYFHDSYDTVKPIVWKSLIKNSVKKDSLNDSLMVYACTSSTCRDSLSKLLLIDTIYCTIFDTKKDSSKVAIALYKGIANRSPVIQSVNVNGASVKDSGLILPVIPVTGGLDYRLAIKVTDPDSNIIKILWNAKYSVLSSKTDTAVILTAPSTMLTDTVIVTASDDEYTATKKFIINVNDLAPRFDSLTINKIKYNVTGAGFLYNANIGEQLVITAYVRDFDVKDTLRIIWDVNDTSSVLNKSGARIVYQLQSKAYSDTIKLIVKDGTVTNNYVIAVKAETQEPIIDSIKVGTKIFMPKTDTITDSISYPTTVMMKVFAHDNQKDSLKYAFKANMQKNLLAVDTIWYNYIVNDSTFIDTVRVSVTDLKNNKTTKNIQLKIKGTK